MTFTDVYIGRLADGLNPLDAGGSWDGNQPKRISGNFPTAKRGGPDPYSAFHDRMNDSRIQAKQIDWGAYAAIVSKADIVSFVFEIYSDSYDPDALPYQRNLYDNLMEILKTLPDDQRYALVAFES